MANFEIRAERERERERIYFYLHHKSQFSLKKRENKELSQTLQKMLPMKNTESNKTSEYNCKTKQQQYKSVMREVGRDNRHLITTPIRI